MLAARVFLGGVAQARVPQLVKHLQAYQRVAEPVEDG